MAHKLTIIMPCYNSSATILEAVTSIYTQNLAIPYEVVMVDDGSTDDTRDLITKLTLAYPNIRYVFHEKNQGGGAARNTAVAHGDGDLIFCLDSDDILPPNTLPKMVNCLDEKKCDGVVFSEARVFWGENKRESCSEIIYDTCRNPLSLRSLFTDNDMISVRVNFLYTKSSFYKTTGYPTHHGFDTQGYGFRYLSKGLVVYMCPDTFYFHRKLYPKTKSYFERVYESGEYSKNIYFILEDVMCLLSPPIRERILSFDIWSASDMFKHNLMTCVKDQYRNYGEANFWTTNYQNLLRPDGWDIFFETHKVSNDPMDIFCCGIYCYKQQQYDKALDYYKQLLAMGYSTRIVYMNIFRILMSMSGQYERAKVETIFQELVNRMTLQEQKLFSRNRLVQLLKSVYRQGRRLLK